MMTPSKDDEGTSSTSPRPLPVQLLTRGELISRVVNDLPGGDRGGTLRSAYPGLSAGTFRSTLIVMPVGQRSPSRESDIEHIIVVLEGSFLFDIDGVKYQVNELDQIFVPVGVTWEYQNAELGQSAFLSIVGP
jgi:quercetin dioxygenase-like cupin family protein